MLDNLKRLINMYAQALTQRDAVASDKLRREIDSEIRKAEHTMQVMDNHIKDQDHA